MRVTLPLLLCAACYEPLDLPVVETVPVVPANACASDRFEEVVCVLDGDTFDVGACGEFGERVRLLGVDAPEIAHDPDPADCYGDIAHDELERLVDRDRVRLSFDEECLGIYGRTLAYVWLTGSSYDRLSGHPDQQEYTRLVPGEDIEGILLNEWLIAQGYARVFPEEQFGRILWQDDLDLAEDRARTEGRGLWSACVDDASGTAKGTAGTMIFPTRDGTTARESE